MADQPTTKPDLSGAPAGRPLKFKDPVELQQRIDEYFANCDPHLVEEHLILKKKASGDNYLAYEKAITEQQPYTITGLAVHLGCDRGTLLNYESGRYFHDDTEIDVETRQALIDTIKDAKAKCEAYAERQLFVGKQAAGPIFNLKNNYKDWKDQSEVLNKNQVVDDLDSLDDPEALDAEKEIVGAEAAKALEEKDGPGSTAAEQVVAPDPPVQNPQ